MYEVGGPEATFVLGGNLHDGDSSGIDRAANVVRFPFQHVDTGFTKHSISSLTHFDPQIYRR
jgi:hypothetical protein